MQSAQGTALATADTWFYRPDESPRLTVDRRVVRTGQTIGVTFTGAPGMGLDWISIFRCTTAGCADNTQYLLYAYTGSAIEGRLSIGPGAIEGNGTWPLPPGRYVARLLPDDGLRSVAESPAFRIAP